MGAAGSARADVFLPADPAPQDARCVSAAGDIVLTVRTDKRGRPIVELSESGSPWQRVAGLSRLAGCPRVAAAADGTVAIAADSRVLVRRPGGRFGAPIAAGRELRPTDLAVASGGWVGVVGTRIREPLVRELVATIVAPDGTSRPAVVERGRSTARVAESFRSPRIGLDASGTATIVWTRFDSMASTYDMRTARATGGGAWGAARSLGDGAAPIHLFPLLGQADVAVAPTGHTLVAWADGKGVRASFDGGPAELLATERDAASPTVALADDGSAVVAYTGRDRRILVSDRSAAAAWSSPHVMSGAVAPVADHRGRPQEVELSSVLAPDGRAVVAWQGAGDVGPRAVAAWRSAGGSWMPAVPLSAITRESDLPWLWLGAAGDPRLVWTERPHLHSRRRLRGARLAADAEAEPSDRTAPIIATRLPARTPRTRTGVVRFRIPVRCSEACDARVRLVDRRSGGEIVGVVRALRADRRTTVRLTPPAYFAVEFLVHERARRPRIEVLVTDRAGNVARRSRTVTVRVVDRPLLSFQVAGDHDFAMFTPAGDRAVGRLVNSLIAALAAGEVDSSRDLRRRYRRGVRSIERAGHEEVLDTAVRDEIFTALQVPLALGGYDAEVVMDEGR
jgi:hypothetical protein